MQNEEETKKKFPVFLAGMISWYFMSGVEYSLILSTINSYLLSTGAPQNAIGYVFTYFAFSGLISSPIYGHFADKLKAVRIPVIVAILFSIVGTTIYTFGRTLMLINIGRFVMGFGWGVDGAIVGKIALLKSDEAGMYIPLLLVMRQVGIILGPLCIFWTRFWDFTLFGVQIDPNNATGLMITILWCVTLGINLVAVTQEPIPDPCEPEYIVSNEKIQMKENGESTLNGDVNANGALLPDNVPEKKLSITSNHRYAQISPLPHLTEQIIVCLTCSLSGYILQSSLEAMVTPLTKNLLGWGNAENAKLFIGIGITAVLGYVATMFLSKFIKPRMTLMMGVIIEIGIVIVLMFMLPVASFRDSWLMASFLSATVVFIFALPFIVVSSATLMANFTDSSQQSTIQGIRVAAERVAQICGPLWGAEVLYNLYIVFLFPLIYLLLSFGLMCVSWSWLVSTKFKKDPDLIKRANA